MTSGRIDIPISAYCNGLVTLHGTGNGTGTGNGIRTIGNNGSWSLSLSQTSVNISSWYIRTHWSFSCSLSLYRSRCGAVWISHCRCNILKHKRHIQMYVPGLRSTSFNMDCTTQGTYRCKHLHVRSRGFHKHNANIGIRGFTTWKQKIQ